MSKSAIILVTPASVQYKNCLANQQWETPFRAASHPDKEGSGKSSFTKTPLFFPPLKKCHVSKLSHDDLSLAPSFPHSPGHFANKVSLSAADFRSLFLYHAEELSHQALSVTLGISLQNRCPLCFFFCDCLKHYHKLLISKFPSDFQCVVFKMEKKQNKNLLLHVLKLLPIPDVVNYYHSFLIFYFLKC